MSINLTYRSGIVVADFKSVFEFVLLELPVKFGNYPVPLLCSYRIWLSYQIINLTLNRAYKWTMQLFNAKGETFEDKTKLQLCLVSMPNMETTGSWETATPIAKQINKTYLPAYLFDGNKTITRISYIWKPTFA